MRFWNRSGRGLVILVLGVGAILSAHYLLHSCADGGRFLTTASGAQIAMRCSWTERAVQGVGGLTAVIGLLMIWWHQAARGLALAASATGVLMMIIPVWLIPTCGTPTMICNLSLKPGAILMGGVVTLVGAALSLRSPAFVRQSERAR